MLSVVAIGLPRASNGFRCAAKRYTFYNSDVVHNLGLTLLCTHCTGAHKEQWEPLLEHLFILLNDDPYISETCKIREAWAIDRVNHGDSYELNINTGASQPGIEPISVDISLDTLREQQPRGSSISDWYPCVADLAISLRAQQHRIVGIGHSAGAAPLVLASSASLNHHHLFESLILVEPSLVTKNVFNSTLEDRMTQLQLAVGATTLRRDVWKNFTHQDLFQWFMDRYPWNSWDPRVVKLYSEYGVKLSQNGNNPVLELKCPKLQEAASFVDSAAHFEATDKLALVCSQIPVHVVYSEELEFMPQSMRDSIHDPKEGRKMAGVHTVSGCGHFLVQEKPDSVAQVLAHIFQQHHNSPQPKREARL